MKNFKYINVYPIKNIAKNHDLTDLVSKRIEEAENHITNEETSCSSENCNLFTNTYYYYVNKYHFSNEEQILDVNLDEKGTQYCVRADLDTKLHDTKFYDTKFDDTDFNNSKSDDTECHDIEFRDLKLHDIDFNNSKFDYTDYHDIEFHDSDSCSNIETNKITENRGTDNFNLTLQGFDVNNDDDSEISDEKSDKGISYEDFQENTKMVNNIKGFRIYKSDSRFKYSEESEEDVITFQKNSMRISSDRHQRAFISSEEDNSKNNLEISSDKSYFQDYKIPDYNLDENCSESLENDLDYDNKISKQFEIYKNRIVKKKNYTAGSVKKKVTCEETEKNSSNEADFVQKDSILGLKNNFMNKRDLKHLEEDHDYHLSSLKKPQTNNIDESHYKSTEKESKKSKIIDDTYLGLQEYYKSLEE